jgi:hypothetical protein
MTTTPSRRAQLRELLQLLASADQQLAYESNVPHVDITVELVCMWFDDLYDQNHAATDPTFAEVDRTALAEFHQFYDERHRRLPKSRGTIRTWLASPLWREIMRKAHETLSQLAP